MRDKNNKQNAPGNSSARSSSAGTTLLDILVALSIVIVLAGIALPNLAGLAISFNRLNAKSYLLQDLKRAQAESITQGCRGIFVIAECGTRYSFGCDYLPYDPSDPPNFDVQSMARNLPSQVTISSTAPIIFNSRGQAVDIHGIISNLTITLTDTASGATVDFANGLLLGTGVFTYD